jgi:hypothetical protein
MAYLRVAKVNSLYQVIDLSHCLRIKLHTLTPINEIKPITQQRLLQSNQIVSLRIHIDL